jgi:hypothetical protein
MYTECVMFLRRADALAFHRGRRTQQKFESVIETVHRYEVVDI